ncbi:MAG: accessory gene regulator B family protein [Eubacterium sp.]|jgi:Membrane protein putatively involved in post-translational modification of the autoinducing quorum-sensing peptide|nr:accessory gene regulator B family protein [Eubacterium sp.]
MFPYAYIKNNLGFSEYETAQIRYFINTILSEMSKLILIGLFFCLQGKLAVFAAAAALLCVLRSFTGGLHMEHYLTCLIMSFLIFFTAIDILLPIQLTRQVQLPALAACILVNLKFAPVVSRHRPVPGKERIRKSRIESVVMIAIFSLLLYVLPSNQYISVGFWIILLQSVQLAAAYYGKRRSDHEIPSAEMDDNTV